MKLILAALLILQFGPRPLTPAETLLEPLILRAINEQPAVGVAASVIEGTDKAAGEILITCRECDIATQAMQKLHSLIREHGMPSPARTIRRVDNTISPDDARKAKAAIFVAHAEGRPIQIVRGLWSTAGIADEVVELFARHGGYPIEVRPFENLGQLRLDDFGVATTTIVANPARADQHAAFVAAASAYFLATIPNVGSEALLSHLTVGAHARLAEDGRRAVALMGNQQRASADVLVMFGHAIEREQRRMRSFERFMPEPVDPVLRGRVADMAKGITSVWTSIGITSSPFVPPSERLRGRGGEDRRVPARSTGFVEDIFPPVALQKVPNVSEITFELTNFMDGKRSISDIRDAVAAEFGNLPLPAVVEHFERLAKAGVVVLR